MFISKFVMYHGCRPIYSGEFEICGIKVCVTNIIALANGVLVLLQHTNDRTHIFEDLLLLFFLSSKMKITIKNMHQNNQDNNKQIIKREKTIQKNQKNRKENISEKL